MGRRQRRLLGPILTVFLFAAAVRAAPILLHRFDADRVTTVDSSRYLELADGLAAGDGFRLPGAAGELLPELFRTPGYPAVLALAGKLPGNRDAWIVGLQVLAGGATVVLCFALVSAWASPRAGLAAAALLALDPAHVVYSNLLMSDVLCAAAVAAALVLIERRGSRSIAAAAAGILLSIATALRPVAVLIAAPAAVYLHRRGRPRAAVAAFVAAALVFPLGWTARNGLSAGCWTLSTAFDVNLALVVASKVEARAHGLARSDAEARVMARVAATDRASDLAFHRACRRVALETLSASPAAAIAEAPVSVAEMLLAGERRYLLRILGLTPSEGRERQYAGSPAATLATYSHLERLAVLAQAAFMAGVWVLAAAGFVALWRRGRRDVALFALAALAVVLAPSLVVATGRMRLPVAVLIHGLAGVGVAAVGEFRRPVTG